MVKKIVIIGGGIAGLSCAYELCKHPDTEITILESRDKLGGNIVGINIGSNRKIDVGVLEFFDFYFCVDSLLAELGLPPIKSTKTINYPTYMEDNHRMKLIQLPYLEFIRLFIFEKHKFNFYLSSYGKQGIQYDKKDNSTINKYLLSLLGRDSPEYNSIVQLFEVYTYPHPEKIASNIIFSILLRYASGRMYVYNCQIYKIIEIIQDKLTKQGHQILTSTTVTKIKDNKIYTHDKIIEADKIIFACSYGDLIKSVTPKNTHIDLEYTKYAAIVAEFKTTPHNSQWFAAFTDPKKHRHTIGYIHMISCEYRNIVIFYFKMGDLETSQVENVFQTELASFSFLKGHLLLKIHHIEIFDYAMPSSPENIKLIQDIHELQGKNNYYFCGQYLGFPSSETACYTGKRTALLCAGTKKELDEFDKFYRHKDREIIKKFIYRIWGKIWPIILLVIFVIMMPINWKYKLVLLIVFGVLAKKS